VKQLPRFGIARHLLGAVGNHIFGLIQVDRNNQQRPFLKAVLAFF
jgi:hypothetical protein